MPSGQTGTILLDLDDALATVRQIMKAGPNKVYIGKHHKAPPGAQIHTSPSGKQYYIPSQSGPKSGKPQTTQTPATAPRTVDGKGGQKLLIGDDVVGDMGFATIYGRIVGFVPVPGGVAIRIRTQAGSYELYEPGNFELDRSTPGQPAPPPAPPTTTPTSPPPISPLSNLSDDDLKRSTADAAARHRATRTLLTSLLAKYGPAWATDPRAATPVANALRQLADAQEQSSAHDEELTRRGLPTAPTAPVPQPDSPTIELTDTIAALIPGMDATAAQVPYRYVQSLIRSEQRAGRNVQPEKVLADISRLLDESFIAIRVDPKSIDSILDHGELANQHAPHVTASGGSYDPTYRRQSESKLFGIPTKDTDWRKRPIFGAVQHPNYVPPKAAGYGSIAIKLKPETKQRATITCANSLGNSTTMAPSPYMAPHIASIDTSTGLLRSNLVGSSMGGGPATAEEIYGRVGSYIETQIHGGVSLRDDVEEIVFADEPRPATKDRLARLGVPWRVDWKFVHGY